MLRKFTYIISDVDDCVFVRLFLLKKGYQSKIISMLKRTENGILVNGRHTFTNYVLCIGDRLEIFIIDEVSSEKIEPENLPIDIVFEDEDILVVNKAEGMPVHTSQGHFHGTLANAVMFHFKGQDFTFRCVNRLDKDTSGLLIIAKNRLSSAILSNMMIANEIKREYVAICKGEFPDEKGIIDAPIARKADSTIERIVDFEKGKRAVTNFEKVKFENGYSLVALRLDTGRTHQIRVHLKHFGFPIVGDFLYNPDYEKIQRQALHSRSLEFFHPITKVKMYFFCDVPLDMKKIFE